MSEPSPSVAATNVGPHDISDLDAHLFCEGTHARIYEKLGAHLTLRDGVAGAQFAVWAPNARAVSVVGDFNRWKTDATPLAKLPTAGIWAGFVPGVGRGELYKYRLTAADGRPLPDKADPYGQAHQAPPNTASVVWNLDYAWQDQRWMLERSERDPLSRPLSIYEVHLGSWMRVPEDGYRSLSYVEIAPRLVEHVKRLGFTHVELLPVMEHPFFGSWGYQATGYFAPSTRYGTPQDFMALIDALHQNGIGVILDFPAAQFPADGHGLVYFDGTHLYEHADPRRREHPEWGSMLFDYGRLEVQSFLISSAVFWLDKFHADGIRVDGATTVLRLGRAHDEAPSVRHEVPSDAALGFFRRFNDALHREYPDALTLASDAAGGSRVTAPTRQGGLGFDFVWDSEWVRETLQYMARPAAERRFHRHELTFRSTSAPGERYLLALSHDEVTPGNGSLLERMPGDEWQKFANLRLLLSFMLASPGKKLSFMGAELGQPSAWSHDGSLDWHRAGGALAQGVQQLVHDLHRLYVDTPALFERDHDPGGFEWIDANDSLGSTLSLVRRSRTPGETVLGVFNFAAEARHELRVGVEQEGYYRELINSDAKVYGGSGQGNRGGVNAEAVPSHGRPFSLCLTVPPLAALLLGNKG